MSETLVGWTQLGTSLCQVITKSPSGIHGHHGVGLCELVRQKSERIIRFFRVDTEIRGKALSGYEL